MVQAKDKLTTPGHVRLSAIEFRKGGPEALFFQYQAKSLELSLMTLEQACLPEYQEAQCAFKDSMIH
jgi:hypothetical protein